MKRLAVWIGLVLLVLTDWQVLAQAGDLTKGLPAGRRLFSIGKENYSETEFCYRGFKGKNEYTYTVGGNIPDSAFPGYVYQLPMALSIDDGVGRVVIRFSLDQAQDEIVFRMFRAGAETTVVIVDDLRQYLVTNSMLGSDEHSVWGHYNLSLGRMEKGQHTIKLTIADDGKGNRRYAWDAISVFVR